MVDTIANMFLINAPAGSGKSTFIEETVLDLLSRHNPPRILCITYTNRAADELNNRISSQHVTIQTIHSFISGFVSVYFKDARIIELFFKIYEDEIRKNLLLTNEDGTLTSMNARFLDKAGALTYEAVKENISEVQYNELQFNSLYYGGLSHDALLSFAQVIFQQYPVLRKRLVDKYCYIFIDEYQDTSDSVLFTFFDAVRNTKTKLYVLGDKMQQIYENYKGDFESNLTLFSTEITLSKNYRSSKAIVSVLNNLYNDRNYIQQAENLDRPQSPRMVVAEVPEKYLQEKLLDHQSLKLLIFNRRRFEAIGARTLYDAVSKMKSYNFPSKYSPVDVLTDVTSDNPDALFRKLFHLISTISYFEHRSYGVALQAIKKSNTFTQEPFIINFHIDKVPFTRNMKYLRNKLYFQTCITISEFIAFCIHKKYIVENSFSEIFNNEEYEKVLSVPIKEIMNVYRYLDNPHVSTQHGVKGEGHDSVYFFAENSSQPAVRIYEFFQLLCCSGVDVNLTDFQNMYYKYCRAIEPAENICSISVRDIKAEQFKKAELQFTALVEQVHTDFSNDPYFKYLLKSGYDKYLAKPNVTNMKSCLSASKVHGVLAAYKLFYVGCSRARKSLTVVVDKEKIDDYADAFVDKMQAIGFEIIYCK